MAISIIPSLKPLWKENEITKLMDSWNFSKWFSNASAHQKHLEILLTASGCIPQLFIFDRFMLVLFNNTPNDP